MRITQVLWRQHIGRMRRDHWWRSSKKVVLDISMEEVLTSRGLKIVDAKDLVPPTKLNLPRVSWSLLYPKPLALDETHPDWNDHPRLTYGDKSILLEGVAQAQVLTKTERINDLPEKLKELAEEEPSPEIESLITRSIYSSHVFDAHQEVLPKRKDPLRPAWNFPRDYGIPEARKMHNLIQKFLQLCHLTSDPIIGQQRKIINDGRVRTYIERGNDLLYFESQFDSMIMSNKLLTPMSVKNDEFEKPLPNIAPLDPTISLEPENVYSVQDHYPVAAQSQWTSPHTIFVHYDRHTVKQKTELPVSEDQILARSILKSFATAACCAKLKFGDEVHVLPEPITVQCVQSDGKWFDFSVFQLNTLDFNSDKGTRNIWWSLPRIELFENAGYVSGRPTVEGYNPDVFKKILAFYRNV